MRRIHILPSHPYLLHLGIGKRNKTQIVNSSATPIKQSGWVRSVTSGDQWTVNGTGVTSRAPSLVSPVLSLADNTGMRDTARGPDDISQTAQVENILRTTNKLFNLDNRRSKAFSLLDLERYYIKNFSSLNCNCMTNPAPFPEMSRTLTMSIMML